MKLLERIANWLPKIVRLRGRPAQAPGFAPPTEAAEAEARGMTIFAGWLIDGSGGSARRNVRLDIREGRIESMEEIAGASDETSAPR